MLLVVLGVSHDNDVCAAMTDVAYVLLCCYGVLLIRTSAV
jgi:hypothetical protein